MSGGGKNIFKGRSAYWDAIQRTALEVRADSKMHWTCHRDGPCQHDARGDVDCQTVIDEAARELALLDAPTPGGQGSRNIRFRDRS